MGTPPTAGPPYLAAIMLSLVGSIGYVPSPVLLWVFFTLTPGRPRLGIQLELLLPCVRSRSRCRGTQVVQGPWNSLELLSSRLNQCAHSAFQSIFPSLLLSRPDGRRDRVTDRGSVLLVENTVRSTLPLALQGVKSPPTDSPGFAVIGGLNPASPENFQVSTPSGIDPGDFQNRD